MQENQSTGASAPAGNPMDEQIPFAELPASQFDTSGRTKSEAQLAEEKAREDDRPSEPLRLTSEQRNRLKANNPALFQALIDQESDSKFTKGQAKYESHPYRPASDLFGKNSIAQPQTNISGAMARKIADKLLALDSTDPRQAEWLTELGNAMNMTPREDFGLEAMNREGSEWVQSIEVPGGRRIHGRVYEYPTRSGQRLTGAAAISFAAAISGAGRPATFPMLSSGWNATFRPATNVEWARYYEQVLNARAELGRSTIGVGYGASRAMYLEHALMFALDHLDAVSFKTGDIPDRSEILRYLSIFDIDAFLTAFLVSCHPDGYPIRMPCANVGGCTSLIDLDANLRTMMIFDRSALTETQLYHMLRNKTGEMDMESVLSYQATLRTNQPHAYLLKKSHLSEEDIRVEFGPCSAWDYIQSSKRYIDRVRMGVQDLITDRTSEAKRADILARHFWTAPMREYSHFVKKIYLGDNVIEEDPDNKDNPRFDLEDYLSRASESETMRTAFRKEALAYQQKSITSILAAPGYDCPTCGHSNSYDQGDKFMDCIPLDVPMVFFNRALLRLTELAA